MLWGPGSEIFVIVLSYRKSALSELVILTSLGEKSGNKGYRPLYHQSKGTKANIIVLKNDAHPFLASSRAALQCSPR